MTKKVIISSMGHSHPKYVIPNSFFETLDIGTDANWISERTGILSRNSVLSPDQIIGLKTGKITSQQLHNEEALPTIRELAIKPWELLQQRHASSEKLQPETVICGTSIPDFDIPANACSIAGHLGLEATSFDVNSACSSFVAGLHVANSLIKSEACQSAALFQIERYSTRMDFNDRRSCILFGDGSAASLVEADRGQPGFEVIDTILESSPAGFQNVKIPEGKCFTQNGSAVQKFAITKTIHITKKILERNKMSTNDIHHFVGHQANLRMLMTATTKLGFQSHQHLFNVDQFGNQGGAGAPCVLSQNWEKIKAGEYVLMAVVGAGLTWGATLLKKRG
jgi:3-oxoacyl-[acyl-carrier-protein] synthase-3